MLHVNRELFIAYGSVSQYFFWFWELSWRSSPSAEYRWVWVVRKQWLINLLLRSGIFYLDSYFPVQASHLTKPDISRAEKNKSSSGWGKYILETIRKFVLVHYLVTKIHLSPFCTQNIWHVRSCSNRNSLKIPPVGLTVPGCVSLHMRPRCAVSWLRGLLKRTKHKSFLNPPYSTYLMKNRDWVTMANIPIWKRKERERQAAIDCSSFWSRVGTCREVPIVNHGAFHYCLCHSGWFPGLFWDSGSFCLKWG